MIGRKYTFLVTIVLMGLSTFVVWPLAELRNDWCRRAGALAGHAAFAGAGVGW